MEMAGWVEHTGASHFGERSLHRPHQRTMALHIFKQPLYRRVDMDGPYRLQRRTVGRPMCHLDGAAVLLHELLRL